MAYQSVSGDISANTVITLIPLKKGDFEHWRQELPQSLRQWVDVSGFNAKAGQFCILPGEGEDASSCIFGMQRKGWINQLAALASKLPQGIYRLQCDWDQEQRLRASLGWGLAAYRFDRYKKNNNKPAELLLDEDIENEVLALRDAQCLVRDLVNTPTEHMGPQQLAYAVTDQADRHDADCVSIVGRDLLTQNFPAIHAVGRASDREPRLIQMTWQMSRAEDHAPLLALVGKGVCFDSGGEVLGQQVPAHDRNATTGLCRNRPG